jgi:hypothetical protein
MMSDKLSNQKDKKEQKDKPKEKNFCLDEVRPHHKIEIHLACDEFHPNPSHTRKHTMSSIKTTIGSLEKQIAAVVEGKHKKIASLNDEHSKKLASLSASSDQEISELTKELEIWQKIEQNEKENAALKASIATPKAVTNPAPSYFGVSDGHSGKSNKKGAGAIESTESSSYGVFITATPGARDSANCEIELSDGTKAIVSKDRWNRAKKISVGSVIFLGDNHRKQVFKGTVLGRTGPFRCNLAKDSFGQRAHLRRISQGIDISTEMILEGVEIELNWSVKWELVGNLTQEWQSYIHFSEYKTVCPLSGPPSF